MNPEAPASAGAMLRAAREKQGLHIAALAAAIKVSPKKLEALEAGRHDELAGAIFTRALAQSVCRVLRIDAKPVLALLPQPDAPVLQDVTGTLNAPFRDRASRDERPVAAVAQRILVIAGLVLMLAAGVLFLMPLPLWQRATTQAEAPPAAASAASAAAAAAVPAAVAASAAPVAVPASASPAASMAASAPAIAVPPASATRAPEAVAGEAAAVAVGPLQIQTSAASWVEVRDRNGRLLLSRLVAPQETVSLDGAFPLRLIIGNAAATRISLRGKAVELLDVSRDNVARLELP